MPPGNDDDDMAWSNDWDDAESTGAVERQQILHETSDTDIDDEIRANLNSKITSSRHAYKVAGIALIVVLVSFTLNTVPPAGSLLTAGIRTVCPGHVTMAEAVLHAVPRAPDELTDGQIHPPFVMDPYGASPVPVPAVDVSLDPVCRALAALTSSFPQNNRGPHPFRVAIRDASKDDARQVHVLCHRNIDLYADSCCKHLVLGGFPDIHIRCNSHV
jgi:hypothetical protein